MVPFYVSTYAIVVLSIDRAYVIVKPLTAASKGNRYRYGLALSSWIAGCVLAIPYGVFGLYTEDPNRCGHKFPNELVILYADIFSIIILPVILISVCYIIIIITIRRRERNGIMQHKHRDLDKDCGIDARDKSISKAKIRSIKLLCVVVFAYLICWAPVTIAAILTHHDIIVKPGLWYQILYLLAPLNSLANPLVFLIFNTKMFLSKTHKTKTRVVSGTALKIT
ncbi:Hypothetical predicted protein [Mytilus galloprovincialis]|uniref:G-protein coupled receptors family 1 profile domain-containing protein n=1 Tax=Mytilus galloprovincialis TaxID=29158 RepID=A0A8B6CTC2_MYTGA|nr:Hypothetical predicted protein [Mytilus galloprovincialis]